MRLVGRVLRMGWHAPAIHLHPGCWRDHGASAPHLRSTRLGWASLHFSAHLSPPLCRRYGFATPSTLKPTQWSYPSGSINQIPGTAVVCGDCRVTPFYDMEEVRLHLPGRRCLAHSPRLPAAPLTVLSSSLSHTHTPHALTFTRMHVQVLAKIRSYVDDINADPDAVRDGRHGPASAYALPDEGFAGRLELKFFDHVGKGVRILFTGSCDY